MKKTILLALALFSAPASAEVGEIPIHPALRDRFYFAVGVFFPSTTTQAELDSKRTGLGANVDFERTLGMEESKAVPSVIARWRIDERFRLEAEFFQLNRSGQRRLTGDVQWGDTTYPVNSTVNSTFDFFDLRVSGGYSFFRRPDKELGVGFGLHVASYDVSLAANAIPTEQQDVLAPLPVISFYGQFALTERWAIGTRLDAFSLKYDKYKGGLGALGIDVSYQPFRYLGFGLAYRALNIHMEAESDNTVLKFRQQFNGPMLFMSASF